MLRRDIRVDARQLGPQTIWTISEDKSARTRALVGPYVKTNVGQKVTGQKVTDKKSQEKKSQFKFCILTKHIGQKVTT
jgi:hypothetical protein